MLVLSSKWHKLIEGTVTGYPPIPVEGGAKPPPSPRPAAPPPPTPAVVPTPTPTPTPTPAPQPASPQPSTSSDPSPDKQNGKLVLSFTLFTQYNFLWKHNTCVGLDF